MKKEIIMTLFAGLVSSSYCLANDDYKTSNYANKNNSYVALKLGYADVKTDENIYYVTFDGSDFDNVSKNISDSGFNGSLSLGRSFGFFRPELELSFVSMNMKTKSKDEVVIGTVTDNFGRETTFLGLGDINHKQEFTNWSLMLNFLFDIKTGTPFTPYLGFGAGYGYNKLVLKEEGRAESVTDNTVAKLDAKLDNSKVSLTYQAMAGVGYKTKGNLEFDIGYKYTNYGDIGNIYTNETGKIKAKANIITFGIKAPF